MTRWPLAISAIIAALAALTAWAPPPTVLLYNVTPSVAEGLYWVAPADQVAPGDIVVIHLSGDLAAIVGRYLAPGRALMKPVVAARGDTVCRIVDRITINGTSVADAARHDRAGRPLPEWHGCRTLAEDEVFPLSTRLPNGFDGRYFGPISTAQIAGKALPLWTH